MKILGLLLASMPLLAQVDLGSIGGTITDATGAVVAGATVEVRNQETNVAGRAASNEQGLYLAPLLRPGRYTVTVEAAGFKKSVRPDLILQVQGRLKVDFQLELGQVTESIEVSAATPLLDTESGSTGTVIDRQKITELPLNGRDWLRLGRMAPGVVSTYRARDRSFTANGMRSIQNTFVIDGVVNVSYLRGLDDRRRDVVRPSVDALQEFKVQTSNFSAELGQSAGAVVNATIKSGTNALHGTVFEFARNSVFDATPFFQPAGTSKPRFNQHQFGGSVGGPIRRDKTFFFAAFEGQRLATAAPQVASVPLAAARAGDFGSTPLFDPATLRRDGAGFARDPFPANRIPENRFDTVAARLRAVYPQPNLAGAVRNFFYNPSRTDRGDQVDARVDHRIGDRDSAFGRFSFLQSPDLAPNAMPAPANPPVFTNNNTRGVAGGWIHNFGVSVVNELRYGFNRILVTQQTNTPRDDSGIPNSLAPGVFGPPVINVTGLNSLGAQGNLPISKFSESHQVLNNLTWVRGRHTWKAGFDFRRIRSFTDTTLSGKGSLNFNGVYTQNPQRRAGTGAPFADLLLGLASDGTVGSRLVSDEFGQVFAGYFQDDWKLTGTLTLNLGLRYEVATPYTEKDNKMENFIYAPGAPGFGELGLAGVGGYSRALLRTDRNNLAPRFGFAWQAQRRTVLRGGYGIFFGQDESYGVVARPTGNPPFFVTVSFPSDQLNPNLTLRGGFPANAVDPRNARFPNAVGYPADFPLPYIQQWGINVQRELAGQWVMEVGYVGSLGLKLTGARNANQPPPGPGAVQGRRPFPLYGNVRAIEPYSRSHYHGLNARAEHRFSGGFTMLAAYTWGHVIDIASAINGEDDFTALPQDGRDLRSETGNAAYDIRQRLAVNYIYELPFGKGKRWAAKGWARHVAGGWTLAGLMELESGRVFNVTASRDSSNTGTTARPNRLRNGVLPRGERTLNRYFDVSAFEIAPDFGFGNSARNPLYGPGRVNFDLAVHRDFALAERARLQFRGELFNAFNTPQFGEPNAVIGNPLAGVIGGAISGPRQIQFGLKLVF